MPDLDDDERRRRLRLLMAWGGPEVDYLEVASWLGVSERTAKRRATERKARAPTMGELRDVAEKVGAPRALLDPWGAEPQPVDQRLAALLARLEALDRKVDAVLAALGLPDGDAQAGIAEFRRRVELAAERGEPAPLVRREDPPGIATDG